MHRSSASGYQPQVGTQAQGNFPEKVRCILVRTYEVYVLVPKLELIEAEDEADLFEKVGKLYKKLYRQEARALIDLLPEPEDCA